MSEHVREGQGGGEWKVLVRANARPAFIEAVILLVVGFFLILTPDGAELPLVRWSVYAVMWTFRLGGLCVLAVALLSLKGWSGAPLADAVVSGLIGVVLVVCGVIWIAHWGEVGSKTGWMGVVIMLFGLLSLHAVRNSLHTHRSVAAMMAGSGGQGSGQSAAEPPGTDAARHEG